MTTHRMPRPFKAFYFAASMLLALTLLSCSRDLREVEITAENQSEIYDQIRNSNALTGQEMELLNAYLSRQQLAEGESLPAGKTIAGMIREQRIFQGESPEAIAGEESATAETRDPSNPPPPTAAIAPEGTRLAIRLEQPLSSKRSQAGETFSASLLEDLTVDGHLLAPEGSRVVGRVTHARPSGKVKGRAQMSLTLIGLAAGDQEYDLRTNTLAFEAEGTKKRDAKRIGIATGAGALIGALAGGKKGAAIGTAIGAGAGAGATLVTAGEEVEFAVEEGFEFILDKELELRILKN